MTKIAKNDHVVCIDESLPTMVGHDSILKLGRVYKVLDFNHYPSIGTTMIKVQDINTKKTDWHHAGKFTILRKEA